MWLYLGPLIKFRASCMTFRVDINLKKWWDRKLDRGRFLSKEMRIENLWKGWTFVSCCFLGQTFPWRVKSLYLPWTGNKWERGVFTHQLHATLCVCVCVCLFWNNFISSLTLCTGGLRIHFWCCPAAAKNQVESDLYPLLVPGITSDNRKMVLFLAETSRKKAKTLILCPCTWAVLEVIGVQVPICRNNCKHLGYKCIIPFLLIRKTLLLIGAKSISGVIGKELSALMGRNLVLFFVRFSSYPLFSVLWLETWFIAAIHLGGSSITPGLLGDCGSSCLLWIRQKSCQSSKAGE